MEPSPLQLIGYLIAAILIGLTLDWATYVRLLDSLVHLGEVRNSAAWSRTMFPRTIFTVTSAILCVVGMTGIGPGWLIILAGIVFGAGQFHAIYRVLTDQGSR
jgi:hypothetical protein